MKKKEEMFSIYKIFAEFDSKVFLLLENAYYIIFGCDRFRPMTNLVPF